MHVCAMWGTWVQKQLDLLLGLCGFLLLLLGHKNQTTATKSLPSLEIPAPHRPKHNKLTGLTPLFLFKDHTDTHPVGREGVRRGQGCWVLDPIIFLHSLYSGFPFAEVTRS